MKAEHRREAVNHGKDRGLSVRRVSALLGLQRSTYYYRPHPRDDSALASRLKEIAEEEKRYGYRRAWAGLLPMIIPFIARRMTFGDTVWPVVEADEAVRATTMAAPVFPDFMRFPAGGAIYLKFEPNEESDSS